MGSWSLGVYDSHKTRMAMKKTEHTKTDKDATAVRKSRLETYSYYFSNGQHCDETKTGRKSVVHVSCCHQPSQNCNDGQQDSMKTFIALQSLKETELCTYEINVCTPLLCPLKLTPTQNRFSVHSLLKPLETVCMQKHEGWWTYEFCYRGQIRQLHLQAVANKNGHRETKVVSEYRLGKYDGRKNAERDEVESPESIRPSLENPERKAFIQDYSGGEKCGITGQTRSTRVYFICKPGSKTTSLISVKEDRTCHYVVVVNTPLLCEHSLFQITTDSAKELVCSLEQGTGSTSTGKGGVDISAQAQANGGKVEIEIDAHGNIPARV